MAGEPASPRPFHFRATRRIRQKKTFRQVFDQGRKAVRPRLVMYALAAGEGEESRLGLAVGRRVGGAVVRNRIRRQLREIFRHRAPLLRPPHDIVVVARAGTAGTSFLELERDFDSALRKLGFDTLSGGGDDSSA